MPPTCVRYQASGPRQRLFSALGAATAVTLMGWMLLFGLPVRVPPRPELPSTLLTLQPPAPPEQPPKPPAEPRKLSHLARPTSARNLKSKATAVVVPPSVQPSPIAVISARQPGAGTAVVTGASNRPGPGSGGSGAGDGSGEGDSGGDDDGGNVPPRLIKGRITASDLPADLRDLRIEVTVSVRYDIDPKGRVSNCSPTGKSGNTELDERTCALIERRFRYDPSRNRLGDPVASTIEEDHHWHNTGNADAMPVP